MRRIQLAPHLSSEELEHRYQAASDTTERSRWQILWLLSKGLLAREVAQSTGYSVYWIGQLARRYNNDGPASMIDRRHTLTERPETMLLSSTQLEDLRHALTRPAPHGKRWTSRTVADWMAERLGRPVAYQRGWDYLQRLGMQVRTPRSRHVAVSKVGESAQNG